MWFAADRCRTRPRYVHVGYPAQPAQAQRVLTDKRLFTFEGERKTGKRGRRAKLYRMVDPQQVDALFGFPFGAVFEAAYLKPIDFSSVLHYKLAILGQAVRVRNDDSRMTQVRTWEVSKQTMIRLDGQPAMFSLKSSVFRAMVIFTVSIPPVRICSC